MTELRGRQTNKKLTNGLWRVFDESAVGDPKQGTGILIPEVWRSSNLSGDEIHNDTGVYFSDWGCCAHPNCLHRWQAVRQESGQFTSRHLGRAGGRTTWAESSHLHCMPWTDFWKTWCAQIWTAHLPQVSNANDTRSNTLYSIDLFGVCGTHPGKVQTRIKSLIRQPRVNLQWLRIKVLKNPFKIKKLN